MAIQCPPGTQGYSGDGGVATEAQLFEPTGLALDVDVLRWGCRTWSDQLGPEHASIADELVDLVRDFGFGQLIHLTGGRRTISDLTKSRTHRRVGAL